MAATQGITRCPGECNPMEEIMHCLFIMDDIAIMFIDDFCNLPAEHMIGNVYVGLPDNVARHDALWRGTH